jgi:predicted chitinase
MANAYTPEEIAELKAREADEIKRFGQATVETRMALLDMAVGAKGATAALTKGFGSLGTSALGLTKQLYDGEVGASVFNKSIGGVSDALGDLVGLIPYVGGALKTLVKGASEYTQAVNKQADLLYSNYQRMSEIGANGAKGMQGVYDNLKRMNYGTEELDKFVSIVKENSDTLAQFGGTVGQGLNQFAAVAQGIQQSDLGTEFRNMGISVDEINKGIASYNKMQMLTGVRQKMTADEQAAAAANYIKEVDLLAKLTGKSRSEQEQAKESAMAEERYAAYKIELQQRAAMGDKAAEEQLKQTESTQIMLDKMAPETRKGFLNILSGTLNTPEAQKLLLTMPNAAAVAGKQTFTQAEFMAAANEDAKKNLSGAGLQLAKMGANNETFIAIQEQQRFANMMLTGTIEERLEAANAEQKVVDQGTKNLTQIQEENRKSRDSLQDLVNAGIVPVTSGMKGLAGATEATIKGMSKMAEKLGVPPPKREEPPKPPASTSAPAPSTPPASAPAPSKPPAASSSGTPSAAAPASPTAAKPKIGGELKDDLLTRLSSSGITDNKAQANILAQFDAESGGQADKKENLNYSAEQLLKTFPKKFKDLADAQGTVSQGQEAIGNKIYGGRMGNAENEGFMYRGRGLIQLTGKDNYAKFGKLLGVDLVKNPDLAADPEIAKQIAVAYFQDKQKAGVNLSNIDAVGKAVGYAGGKEETAKRAGIATAYQSGTATAAAPAAKPTPQASGGTATAAAGADDLTKLMKFGSNSGSKSNFEAMEPTFKNAVIAAAKEYQSVTGKQLVINSAKRDSEDQQRLWDETVKLGTPGIGPTGMKVGKPGQSKHEKGLAVDVQNYRDAAAVAALNKQGLTQKVAGDPVHFTAKNGGIVPALPGGVNVLAGENGQNEAVVPLPDGKSIPIETARNNEQMDVMFAQLGKMDELIRIMQNQLGVSEKLLKYAQ